MSEQGQQEKFIDADALAKSLGETRRYVLYLARTGVIRSYPMGGRERIKRKFKLSEVKSDLVGRKRKLRRNSRGTMPDAEIRTERKASKSAAAARTGKHFHRTSTQIE